MISIGINIHKKKCVATKQESRKKLEQTSFDNTTNGIMGFIKHIKKTYGNDIQAVCESTANYWIRLHDTLEETESRTKCLKTQKHDLCNTCKI